MIKWLMTLFACEHDWCITHVTTTLNNKKVGGGTVMTTTKQVIRECSKCGKTKKDD